MVNTIQNNNTDIYYLESWFVKNLPIIECAIVEKKGKRTAFIVEEKSGDFTIESIKEIPSDIQVVKMAKLPRTNNNQIDRSILENLNVSNPRLIQTWETMFNSIEGIKEAAVVWREEIKSSKPLHLNDIFPEQTSIQDENKIVNDIKSLEHIGISEPAMLYGGDLKVNPHSPNNLITALKRSAMECKDKGIIYVLQDGTEINQTYPELLEEAERILSGLRSAGLKPQDPVILQLEKNEDFIPVFWACVLGGIIPSPVSVAPTYTEINAVVNKLHNAWELLQRPIIITDISKKAELQNLNQLWQTTDIHVLEVEKLRDNEADKNHYQPTEDDIVLNLFSSGSTGMPKCIQHRHSSILARIRSTQKFNDFTRNDVSLNWMPLDHIGGIVMFHIRDIYIGCQHISPKIESFIANPLIWLKWVEKYKATITWAPNFAFSMLNEYEQHISEGSWDLSSLTYIMNAAEQVVTNVCYRFLEIMQQHGLPATAMVPAYGMSETSSAILQNKDFHRDDKSSGVQILDKDSLSSGTLKNIGHNHPNKISITEVGQPIPSVQIRIVNQNNQILPVKTIGRLQVKSPTIMAGYYNNPKANDEVFIEDGWFNTGDLAFIDKGSVIITGREKEVIIINGANFLNYEIEEVVEGVENVEVTFAAACGITDPEAGSDKLAIFFVPKSKKFTDTVKTIQKIRQDIVRKVGIEPYYIVPLEKSRFPKTNSSKIQRSQLGASLKNGEFDEILKQIDLNLKNEKTIPNWLYTKGWKVEALHHSTVQEESGHLLIFMDKDGLGNELIKRLEKQNKSIISVYRGEEFKYLDQLSYQINPKIEVHYEELIEDLVIKGIDITKVVHLFNYEQENVPSNLEDLNKTKENSVLSVLYFIQSAANAMMGPLQFTFVTSSGHLIHTNDRFDYQKSMMTGLLKTIPDEWISCKVTHLDLDHMDILEDTTHLELEMKAVKPTPEVAYRNSQRFVPFLEKVDVENSIKNEGIIPGGMYLITGGLGGIGLEISKHMLKEYNIKLIITGRSTKHEEVANRFKELQKYGDVLYFTADVNSLVEMRQVISTAALHWNQKLAGVFHLAGVGKITDHWNKSEDYSLLTVEPKDFLNEMKAKVDGAWVIANILENYPESSIVFFSSVNGFFGGASFAAYSAANSFLDGFAQYLKYKNGRNAISLAWSMWDNLGMSKDNPTVIPMNNRGFHKIPIHNGINFLKIGMKFSEPLIFVGIDDSKYTIRKLLKNDIEHSWEPTLYYTAKESESNLQISFERILGESNNSWRFIELEEMPITSEGEIDRYQLMNLSESIKNINKFRPLETKLQKEIAEIWSEVLDIKEIGLGENFFQLGGHSIKATRVIALINKKYNLNCTVALLFETQSIDNLSKKIESMCHNNIPK